MTLFCSEFWVESVFLANAVVTSAVGRVAGFLDRLTASFPGSLAGVGTAATTGCSLPGSDPVLISITRVVKARVTLLSLARSDKDVPWNTSAWASSTAKVSAAHVLPGMADACWLRGSLKLPCLQAR